MAEIQFIKQAGILRPAHQADLDALQKIHNGKTVVADIKQPRNPEFHRRFFALLNFGFEYWNPPELEYHGIKSEKSFERFRKEVTVLAGYFSVTTDLRGKVRLEAKSISFASMDETEFQALYKAVFDVLWKYVLSQVDGMTEAVAMHTMEELLRFQ